MKALFDQFSDARSLAETIVDTVRDPLLVLDDNAKILFASSSFSRLFQIDPEDACNKPLFALDGGAWDIPVLRTLLARMVPERNRIEDCEIVHDFPRIGRRILVLHAHKAHYADNTRTIVLVFEDATERRAIEQDRKELQRQTEDLLRQKQILLDEMEHRILNSLQIIASVLMLKARTVTSEETRQHLQDAHRRVMSVAAVQRHLHSSGRGELIDVRSYLAKLCDSLAESMIDQSRPAKLEVLADDGELIAADAVSLGLIVTELVINALKYAFPVPKASAAVIVRYEVNGSNWKLSVSDNGIGKPDDGAKPARGGLGTSLVSALAHQLYAEVATASGSDGLNVSVTHATFTSRAPLAA